MFWNCELDTLRGDLGMFGFPSKAVQYDFLARCKPVFYIRQRDYSKTVSIAPFIVNYSGCLFREYPGPWQVMLRQDSGVYACVAEDSTRCALPLCRKRLRAAVRRCTGTVAAAGTTGAMRSRQHMLGSNAVPCMTDAHQFGMHKDVLTAAGTDLSR